jgi:hypothetical protein
VKRRVTEEVRIGYGGIRWLLVVKVERKAQNIFLRSRFFPWRGKVERRRRY